MTEKNLRTAALRGGRKAFRGYGEERAISKRARQHMLKVFMDKGVFLFADALRRLIRNPRIDAEGKRVRFEKLLDKYVKAVAPRD
jgi:hypothetical protein